MAVRVLTNAFFSFNAVDLSAHVNNIDLGQGVDEVEDTAMADSGRSFVPGLENATITVNFNQDDAASQVSATLDAAKRTSVAFIIRPDSGAIAVTNPEYTGTCFWTSYSPITGAVGDLATAPCTLRVSGVVARATA